MKKDMDINIDALLRDTFLTVVELRQGTTVRHGIELYRHCQRQVELVRERLKDAGFSRENVEHITYAQCALLDEMVLSRSGMDDGHPAVVKGAAAGRTASATGRAKTDRRGFANAVDAN